MNFAMHTVVSSLVRASILSASLAACATAPADSSVASPSTTLADVSLTSVSPSLLAQTHVGAANKVLPPPPSCHVGPALSFARAPEGALRAAQRSARGLVCTGSVTSAEQPRGQRRACSRSRQCSMPSHELGSEGTMDPARARDSI